MIKYFTRKKSLFVLYILLVPAMALTSVWFSQSLQPLVDCIFLDGNHTFLFVSLMALLAGVTDMLAMGLHKTVREKLRCSFLASLRQDMFASVLETDIAEFNKKGTSYYLNVITRDINTLSRSYFDSMCGIFRVVVSFLVTLGALLFMNPFVALLNVFVCALSVFLPKLLENRLIKAQNASSASFESFLQRTKDYLNGFTTIRLFHVKEQMEKQFEKENKNQTQAECSSTILNYWVSWIPMLCSTLCYVLTIIISAWFVIRGDLSVGGILAISQLIGGVVAPFEELPSYITELASVKEIQKKLRSLLDTPCQSGNTALPPADTCDIHLRDVSFSYEEDKTILNHISYHFAPGKKYVLIGESGSGKSTLAKVIMGFYPLSAGSVEVNGISLEHYSKNSLYHSLNYMQQNVFLFSDTLYHNLTLYQDYEESLLQKVIQISGLEHFVNSLEKGLQTEISEDGGNVSGGERQRIGMARTLLLGAKYIIFDETTSGLDALTEHQIENSILSLKDMGCIFITHRLNPSLLENCDEIVVLKDGAIREHGTFKELMGRKEYFYSFYMVNH